jgi:hypothetical protein
MNIKSLTACVAASLLCSCASTSVKQTWKSPDYPGGPMKKLAVVALDERIELRRGFENRLAARIEQFGTSTLRTYEIFSLAEINQDKQAAADRLRAAGADAVVILRLRDVSSVFREYRPSPERYADVITGFEPGTWYDYYSVGFMDMSPTYGSLKQKVYLETSVFDLKTAKRVWSGLTETVITETMDRVAEMDPIVAKAVEAMRKDRIIQ